MRSLSDSKILIIDDHHIIRAGLISALQRAGTSNLSQAASAKDGLSQIATFKFDLIIADQNLKDGTGITCLKSARASTPAATLVLFTVEESWSLVALAEQSGANLFLSKATPLESIIESLQMALNSGERFSFKAPSLPKRTRELPCLTATELVVLEMIAQGFTSLEIAERRNNSEATIKSHTGAIYRKLSARNRVEAVRSAQIAGLI